MLGVPAWGGRRLSLKGGEQVGLHFGGNFEHLRGMRRDLPQKRAARRFANGHLPPRPRTLGPNSPFRCVQPPPRGEFQTHNRRHGFILSAVREVRGSTQISCLTINQGVNRRIWFGIDEGGRNWAPGGMRLCCDRQNGGGLDEVAASGLSGKLPSVSLCWPWGVFRLKIDSSLVCWSSLPPGRYLARSKWTCSPPAFGRLGSTEWTEEDLVNDGSPSLEPWLRGL